MCDSCAGDSRRQQRLRAFDRLPLYGAVALEIPNPLFAIVGLSLAGVAIAPGALGVLLLVIAVVCIISSGLCYPPALAAHTRVLQQFDGSLPGSRRSPYALAVGLVFLDLLLCLVVLYTPHLVLWPVAALGPATGPVQPLQYALLHLLPLPVLALIGTLAALRLHLREVIVLGEGQPIRRTIRMVREHPGELSRRAAIQLGLLAGTISLGIGTLPFAGIPVALLGALLGGLHYLVYAIGYEGSLHFAFLTVEIFALSFLLVGLICFVLSPLTLAQALYRLEYVRGLLGKVKLFVPSLPPEAGAGGTPG